MNESLEKGKLNYSELRQIIVDFYQNRYGIKLSTISIDYLKHQLITNSKNQPFFIINGEYGEKRFDLSKEEIREILKYHLAKDDYELVDLSFDYDIMYSYRSNPNIKEQVEKEILTRSLVSDKSEIPFNGKMNYEDLRNIIFDFYKTIYGIELNSISIGYLIDYLKNDNNKQHFFIINTDGHESRFTIPKDDIIRMLVRFLNEKGYGVKSIDFKELVEFEYVTIKAKNFKLSEIADNFHNKDDITREESPIFHDEDSSINEENFEPIYESPVEELARMAREDRKFTILQRERAMTDAERARTRSAVLAGMCILGAAATIYFSGQDVTQVLQNEVKAIYSWEALAQYIKDLGPLKTLLTSAAGVFVARYFRNSRRLRQAQNEFIDFNSSLEISETKRIGR